MIKFHSGSHCTLMPSLLNILRENKDGCIVLVPEQFTLTAEKLIYSALELSGSFDIQVMSPHRLCTRIFDETGMPGGLLIDDRGRVMLLHRAARELKEALGWYRGSESSSGFIMLAAEQIKEFKQSGTTVSQMRQIAALMPEGALKSKLTDVCLLWEKYNEYMDSGLRDAEDNFSLAIRRLPDAGFLKDLTIAVYGYDVLPPYLASLLIALAAQREVNILLPLELGSHDPGYDPIYDAYIQTQKLAALNSVRCITVQTEEGTACSADDLDFLRKHITAADRAEYPSVPKHIRLLSASSPFEEMCAAFALIRDRVMKGKLRYRDCVIVCSDLSMYSAPLQRAAELYSVPLFLSEGRSADRNAISRFLIQTLKLISSGYAADDMEQLLGTGYCPVTDEDCETLLTCMREQNLRGSLWKKPLYRGKDTEANEKAEPLRQQLITPIDTLEKALKDADSFKDQLTAIWSYLEEVNAYPTLQRYQQFCADSGFTEAANENAQVWNRLCSTMDQLWLLMDDTKLAPLEIAQLLDEALAASDIRPLPQSQDAVTAGETGALKEGGKGILIVAGCVSINETAGGGLFDLTERDILAKDNGIWLTPGEKYRTELDELALSSALAPASGAVIFSCCTSDAFGKALHPNAVITRLKELFPELKEPSKEKLEALLLNAPNAAYQMIGSCLSSGEMTADTNRALSALMRTQGMEVRLDRLKSAAVYKNRSENIGGYYAGKLYSGPTSVSVTRLESFASCPFKHFIRYGLRPQEKMTYDFESDAEGTFYHDALERFVRENNEQLASLTEEQAQEKMDALSESLIAPLMDGPLGDRAELLAKSLSMRRIARRGARMIVKHLKDSHFKPCGVEMDFGAGKPVLTLDTAAGSVALQGRIDRVDSYNDGENTWLRIIDYKSGSTKLNIVKLYYGLQLQLIIYIAAAIGEMGDSLPAGAFYFHVSDPLIKSDATDEETVEEVRSGELRLSGLYIKNGNVLRAMSPQVDKVVTLKFNKDGELSSNYKALEEEDFSDLMEYALRCAAKLTRRITEGDTDITPIRLSGWSPCDWCDYSAVCQRDKLLGGMPRTPENAPKEKEVLERIKSAK